jgi:hypothetical protein
MLRSSRNLGRASYSWIDKLDPNKPFEDLAADEMWGLFLKYANDPKLEPKIKQIIGSRDGVRRGVHVLQQISEDREKRIALYRMMKYEADAENNRLAAIKSGYDQGRAESAEELKKTAIKLVASEEDAKRERERT